MTQEIRVRKIRDLELAERVGDTDLLLVDTPEGTKKIPKSNLLDDVYEDYSGLKKVIIDENASANLQDQINRTNSELDTKASQTDLETQKARIDNFTSLADGSTTGDAELADIRVGVNGNIYNSAGDAVRSQVSELSSVKYTYNLAKDELISGTSAATYKNRVLTNTITDTKDYADIYVEKYKDATKVGSITEHVVAEKDVR